MEVTLHKKRNAEDDDHDADTIKMKVNFDTSSLIVATSSTPHPCREHLLGLVTDEKVVVTYIALKEFLIALGHATEEEQDTAAQLLPKLTIIPAKLSHRFRQLRVSRRMGKNDLSIFGTGDRYRLVTYTSDQRFIRSLSTHLKFHLLGPLSEWALKRINWKRNGSSSEVRIFVHSPCALNGTPPPKTP